jgi:hypothetical protein
MKPEHDPTICFCGTDTCSCPCEKCHQYRARELRLKRRQELAERLEKANVSLDDLADLIWMKIEPTIENRIERLARDALRRMLRDIRLVSQVDWSSLEWIKPAKPAGAVPKQGTPVPGGYPGRAGSAR